jgi:hypothetical protein
MGETIGIGKRYVRPLIIAEAIGAVWYLGVFVSMGLFWESVYSRTDLRPFIRLAAVTVILLALIAVVIGSLMHAALLRRSRLALWLHLLTDAVSLTGLIFAEWAFLWGFHRLFLPFLVPAPVIGALCGVLIWLIAVRRLRTNQRTIASEFD